MLSFRAKNYAMWMILRDWIVHEFVWFVEAFKVPSTHSFIAEVCSLISSFLTNSKAYMYKFFISFLIKNAYMEKHVIPSAAI